MKISISIKLILMTLGILFLATVSITLITSGLFEKKTLDRESDSNLESASAKATEIEHIITSTYQRTKGTAFSYYKSQSNPSKENLDEFMAAFNRDSNLISLEIYKVDKGTVELLGRKVKEEALVKMGFAANYLAKMREQQKFPIRSVIQGGPENAGTIEIKSNNGTTDPAIFTMGMPLVQDQQKKTTHIVIADIQLSVLQKPFSNPTDHVQFIVDRDSRLLVHSEKEGLEGSDMNSNTFVQKAMLQTNPTLQNHWFDIETKQNNLVAFSRTSYGVAVFSQISEEIILEAAKQARHTGILITGIVFSFAILVVYLASMTITSPIETLAQMIALVSKGNFDVKARAQVRSNDEVGDLAIAFDQMTDGLKERDKVKSLFSKFHGSSVTEDLINKEIGLGGQNKDVVVFFSDIRGFTAFSEKRSPEEVVEMLNEYFGAMVKIINKYGGVVDKFIGDAIMAVWGVPKSGDRDCANAVKACMDMRKGLEDLNEKRIARGHPPINIGMGLHAGQAISGTIGSDEKMEYTVIGNTVNTASRIEASTKAFGADLLITDDVLAKVGDEFQVELAGAAEVKGRTDAIKMYKVRAYKDEAGNYITVKTPYSDYEAEKADKVKIAAAH